VKKLVAQHDSQRRLAHPGGARSEDDPLTKRDPPGGFDTVCDGDGGDVGPLSGRAAAGPRLELPLRAGGHHVDVLRPIESPEGLHGVDGMTHVRGDACQQGLGLRPAEVRHHQGAVTDVHPPRRADTDGRLLGSLRRWSPAD
jgi:hypothetical protein